MKLKNNDLRSLANFLVDEKLGGKASRMRTRFIKILNERLKEVEEFRIELLEKYAKKDDEGKAILTEGSYELDDLETFNKEYADLMDEEFIIDETESKREMLTHVKRILENTEKEFNGADAFAYDRWCETFENLKYEDKASPKE
ncbi:DUF1617 family protein [Alkalihalobacterium alkalinitrilicum]|uniref:DUF1617 family protein n=1 Tax=Alkalihalobacterium alkalinitrilicum TaxID=427920 RepID=UPI000995108F|nr:DUF1617 family protein [Alkalihalobacterium alkalinitrilicum]